MPFIAELFGKPAGYAYAETIHRAETSFHFAHAMVYLHHISVRPECRRQGVGNALLEAVRSVGKDHGIGLMTAEVWVFNDDARAFFRRNGFSASPERLWDLS
jgi:diamine N-acetyltransferase